MVANYEFVYTYDLFNDVFNISDYIALNGKMISEWWIGKMLKEAAIVWFDVIRVEQLRKNTKNQDRILGVSGEIWIGHLPNTSQKICLLNQLSPYDELERM
jgi:hypothetical protein